MRESIRLRRPAARVIESLEPRTLLSATLLQPIPNAKLTQDTPQSIDISGSFEDPNFSGTLVQIQTTLGAITLELADSAAPGTVTNFLNYVNSGSYNGTIIHRVVNDTETPFQIVQGGGYDATGLHIATPFGTIQNEFNLSNVRGTIAMAKLPGDPDSATSEWFINDSDNTSLDTNDGGFTVFGQVISGMNIVDSITGLPTIDGSALNANFGTSLPTVDNLANGSVPAPSDLVEVSSVSVLPKISFTALSDTSSVVAASIAGSQLMLTPSPGATGFAHVTVTATDLAGHSVVDNFRVEVDPTGARALDVTLGAGLGRTIGYRDSDGTRTTIAFNGPGTAVLHFAGDAVRVSHVNSFHIAGANLLLMGIDATGTNAASSIKVTATGGKDHIALIGGLTTDGSFNSVNIIRTQVLSDVNIPGGVGVFRCDYARGGTLNLGGTVRPNTPLSVTGLTWVDENLVTTTAITRILSGNWVTSDNVSETIQAPVVRKISAFGNLSPGLQISGAVGSRALGKLLVRGAIGGTWNVAGGVPVLKVGSIEGDFNGTFPTRINSLVVAGNFVGSLTAPSIGKIIIRGAMNDALLSLTAVGRDLGSLLVKGGITTSLISATGSIGSITARFLNNSNVYAGIAAASDQNGLPSTVADFTINNFVAQASIAAINTTSLAGNTFVNTNIAATFVGALNLGRTFTQNSATPFGVATASLGHLSVFDKSKKRSISLINVHDAAGLAAQVAAKQLVLGDLQINIV